MRPQPHSAAPTAIAGSILAGPVAAQRAARGAAPGAAASAPLPEAAYISFIARSDRAHSTSLPLADALQLEALPAATPGRELAEIIARDHLDVVGGAIDQAGNDT